MLFAIAQIVVCCAGKRSRAVGLETLFGNKVDTAVFAHLDDFQPFGRRLVHPVLILELGYDALDAAFDAERFVAADAAERFFFLENASGRS